VICHASPAVSTIARISVQGMSIISYINYTSTEAGQSFVEILETLTRMARIEPPQQEKGQREKMRNLTARYFAVEPRTIRGRGQRQIAPYQDDYLFASPPLARRLAGVEVLDTPRCRRSVTTIP
jgi:hypothetical protein